MVRKVGHALAPTEPPGDRPPAGHRRRWPSFRLSGHATRSQGEQTERPRGETPFPVARRSFAASSADWNEARAQSRLWTVPRPEPMSRLRRAFRTLRTTPGLLVAVFLSILLGLAYSFVVPFMSMFGTREVGMSHFEFGVFMTVTSLSGIVISTLLARSSDTRWSRKSVLLLGGGGGAFGYFGYAFVRNPLALTAIGALSLGVASISFGQIFAFARDTLEESELERTEIPFYMNFIRLFFALAWTVGPAIAAYLMTHYSFRVTFSAAAFTYVVFCALVALFVPWRLPSEASRQAAQALPLSVAFKNR
ncbi:MAG: MFS transporter, partial [Polyangiaceae bacterium]